MKFYFFPLKLKKLINENNIKSSIIKTDLIEPRRLLTLLKSTKEEVPIIKLHEDLFNTIINNIKRQSRSNWFKLIVSYFNDKKKQEDDILITLKEVTSYEELNLPSKINLLTSLCNDLLSSEVIRFFYLLLISYYHLNYLILIIKLILI